MDAGAAKLAFFRPRDVRLGLALLDAFVAHEDGGLPDPRACGALQELDLLLARLPWDDRWRARAGLRVIDWSPPLVLLGRGPRTWRRFRALPLELARAHLDALAVSPAAPLRACYTALKALVMLAYYTREATWKSIGYDGPWLGRIEVEVMPAPRPGLIA